jgi:hypothetical protein
MPEKQNKRQIAFARERLVVGEVILALLMAILERHSRSLKDNFGSSLETMAIGMAVLLSQLADEPSSIMVHSVISLDSEARQCRHKSFLSARPDRSVM